MFLAAILRSTWLFYFCLLRSALLRSTIDDLSLGPQVTAHNDVGIGRSLDRQLGSVAANEVRERRRPLNFRLIIKFYDAYPPKS